MQLSARSGKCAGTLAAPVADIPGVDMDKIGAAIQPYSAGLHGDCCGFYILGRIAWYINICGTANHVKAEFGDTFGTLAKLGISGLGTIA